MSPNLNDASQLSKFFFSILLSKEHQSISSISGSATHFRKQSIHEVLIAVSAHSAKTLMFNELHAAVDPIELKILVESSCGGQ